MSNELKTSDTMDNLDYADFVAIFSSSCLPFPKSLELFCRCMESLFRSSYITIPLLEL